MQRLVRELCQFVCGGCHHYAAGVAVVGVMAKLAMHVGMVGQRSRVGRVVATGDQWHGSDAEEARVGDEILQQR